VSFGAGTTELKSVGRGCVKSKKTSGCKEMPTTRNQRSVPHHGKQLHKRSLPEHTMKLSDMPDLPAEFGNFSGLNIPGFGGQGFPDLGGSRPPNFGGSNPQSPISRKGNVCYCNSDLCNGQGAKEVGGSSFGDADASSEASERSVSIVFTVMSLVVTAAQFLS